VSGIANSALLGESVNGSQSGSMLAKGSGCIAYRRSIGVGNSTPLF
jgi:hypothetical protein